MLFSDLQKGVVLLVDKPLTWTSFDVVNYIRKMFKVKIGHAGTLDPLATGLLILCTGSMTKKIDEFQAKEKQYTGKIRVGSTTPSFDLETVVDSNFPIAHISDEEIREAARSLTGILMQEPPLFSAKKINGERAYLKARRGETTVVESREISVSQFEITGIHREEEQIEVSFDIVCSKGTYIRSLARDLGQKLESGAHLVALCRTRIGEFRLEDALSMEDVKKIQVLPGDA
jgi:tRNA pseudouridine55 synthase